MAGSRLAGANRFRLTPSLCLALLTAFTGACTELDDPPVWVDFDYQVRCVDCVPMAQHNEPHRIAALDGDDGLSVQCTADGDKITLVSDKPPGQAR